MRKFVQVNNGVVTSETNVAVDSTITPEFLATPGLVEVTGQSGAFVGKNYNAGVFSAAAAAVDPVAALRTKASNLWTVSDVADWLKSKG